MIFKKGKEADGSPFAAVVALHWSSTSTSLEAFIPLDKCPFILLCIASIAFQVL